MDAEKELREQDKWSALCNSAWRSGGSGLTVESSAESLVTDGNIWPILAEDASLLC